MDVIYNFIIDNTVMIIIVTIILLMAVIGYVAEKNGFKPNKEDFDEDEPLEPVYEEPEKVTENIEPEPTKEETTKEEPITEEKEDVKEEVKEPEEEKPSKENLNIDKDFSKLLDDEDEIVVGDTDDTSLADIDDDLWKF